MAVVSRVGVSGGCGSGVVLVMGVVGEFSVKKVRFDLGNWGREGCRQGRFGCRESVSRRASESRAVAVAATAAVVESCRGAAAAAQGFWKP
ncbi:hypothetical protein V6N11_033331 [Hibiscus sabdariffa]|uniref:Uncharacterized protein n=1 Tax=Hibiscus sabdariffa TaxID=183260 RepID=A0ABR2PXX1_9ROSI